MSKKPNIIFFFTDDQRFDTIRALGNESIITPNLDKLAAEGTVFTNAHIPGGLCPGVCMPSRAMLNTGRNLFGLYDLGQRIPGDHTMLGECLRDAGYSTYGFGKWHNGIESFNRNFDDGDEIMFGGGADHWNVPVFHYDPTGCYASRIPILDRLPDSHTVSNKIRWRMADHVVAGKHSTDLIAESAVSYLERHDCSLQPFYMYLSFLAPHDPRSMPQKYLDMYKDVEVKLPENYMASHPFDNGELFIRDELLASFPRQPEEIVTHIREYYAMITHADDQIGKVVAALKAKGEYENTIIIFAGDNGLALGQHGLMGKQNCYEHSIRVPLIMAGPGIQKDVRSESLVYLFDIYPSLCELLNLDTPASVQGRSFARTLEGEQDSSRNFLYLAYKDLMRAVKDKQYKLIEYVLDNEHTMTQLFDIEKDPNELENLALDPEFAGIVSKFRDEMRKYCKSWQEKNHECGSRFWSALESSDKAKLLRYFPNK